MIILVLHLIIQRRPIKAFSQKEKKQLCLDCNGAVASPALLEIIPHV